MPRWGEHLIIANRILDESKIAIDKNLFLFGNILPDVQDGYLIKDISNIIPHTINHFDYENGKSVYQNFYNEYKDKINNSVILGYFTHLMTDYLWNKKFEEKCILDENNNFIGYYNIDKKIIRKNKEESGLDKQRDFRIFESYIFSNYDIEGPVYNDNLAENSNLIEIININKDDVRKVVKYINNSKNNFINNKGLDIFNEKELENYIDFSVKYILDYYEKIELK